MVSPLFAATHAFFQKAGGAADRCGWGGEAEPGSGGSYLLGDNDERVSVLGQEVEDAPDLEGIVVADGQLVLVQVLAAAQRPAHLVELLLVKVVGHLGGGGGNAWRIFSFSPQTRRAF